MIGGLCDSTESPHHEAHLSLAAGTFKLRGQRTAAWEPGIVTQVRGGHVTHWNSGFPSSRDRGPNQFAKYKSHFLLVDITKIMSGPCNVIDLGD